MKDWRRRSRFLPQESHPVGWYITPLAAARKDILLESELASDGHHGNVIPRCIKHELARWGLKHLFGVVLNMLEHVITKATTSE